MIMVPDAAVYDSVFVDLPVPMSFPFLFFNLTNANEWLKGGPARLEQIGPYGYV